ncbi:MAG: PEP-CTERM sorting domain-containing protein [Candidatus Korobacteraceae bacterium]
MVRCWFFVLCLIAVAPRAAFAGSLSTEGLVSDGIVLPGHPYVDNFDNDFLTSTASFDCSASSGTSPAFCFQSSPALLTAVPVGDNTVLLASGTDISGGETFSSDNSFAAENPDRAGMSSDLATVVPEPGSILLMGTGVLAIAATVRRKRKP